MGVRFTELDVINTCITSTGEAILNTADPRHPKVQVVQNILKRRVNSVNSQEWYFNRERGTLAVDVDGFVQVADTVGKFVSDTLGDNFQIRGNRLYDMNNGTFVIGRSVTGKIIRIVPFEQMPLEAQAYVMYDCLIEFSQSYDVDAIKIQNAEAQRDEALLTMKETETMQPKQNILDNHTSAMFLSGIRPISTEIPV